MNCRGYLSSLRERDLFVAHPPFSKGCLAVMYWLMTAASEMERISGTSSPKLLLPSTQAHGSTDWHLAQRAKEVNLGTAAYFFWIAQPGELFS